MNEWTKKIERLEAENKRLLAELDKHKWISVLHDLPEDNREVLVVRKVKTIDGGFKLLHETDLYGVEVDNEWHFHGDEVVYWMDYQPFPSTEGI